MEDGEISDTDIPSDGEAHGAYESMRSLLATPGRQDVPGVVYDPALEWPGEPSTTGSLQDSASADFTVGQPSSSASLATSSLRLLVQRSAILSKKHTIAVIDGYTEVQFGRDVAPAGVDTPRIRLKEMVVSKLHATVFWDVERQEWAVVDMGSMHGTFLDSGRNQAPSGASSTSVSGSATSSQLAGVRLSPSRTASIPRSLQHLDTLTIGSTTFVIHIHLDQIPCVTCSPQANDEIPLFDTRREAKRKRDSVPDASLAPPTHPTERNPKKALTALRQSLLSRPDLPSTTAGRTQYLDRSARRRALHRDSPLGAPGTPSPSYVSSPAPTPVSHSAPATPPVSAPSMPLPTTNVGHRLLTKQGWEPGTSLGQPSSDIALITPLEISGNVGRAGLGMSDTLASKPDRRDSSKARRWAELRE